MIKGRLARVALFRLLSAQLCFYGFIGALLAACMKKIYTLTGELRKGPYRPLEAPYEKNLPGPPKTKKL